MSKRKVAIAKPEATEPTEQLGVGTVVHFHRRPMQGYHSLERLFADVRQGMPEVNCRVHVAPCFSLGLWKRLWNTIDAAFHQGDVNHITGDIHYVALLLSKRKTLLTIPDCASLERLHGWRRTILRWIWYSLPVRRAGLISVISEATKAELLRHVQCNPDKIRVVHCCISVEMQRDPRPFNSNTPQLLQIGTGKNKNLLRVAEALKEIPCRLQIIGRLDAEQETALRVNRIDYKAVEHVSDAGIVDAYRQCDLVVFASTYEGFGLPIVEANAVGRPVITSNLLSMPEVAGDAACLVDPFDPMSIREGVLRVLKEPDYRRQLIENGYSNAERFRPATIARAYLTLYRELAAASAR